MSYTDYEFNYVYVLRDPRTKKVHYVGTSVNPKVRFRQHLSLKDRSNITKRAWIQDLKNQGLEPELFVIEECWGMKALSVEEEWIENLISLGHPLTNLHKNPVYKQ